MSKVSQELKEFKKILELDEAEYLKDKEIEDCNLDLLISTLKEETYILDDERHESYCIYSVEEIFITVILALFANCNTFIEIESFIECHYEWLENHIKYSCGAPSISTIKRVIAMIKPEELEEICNNVFFKFSQNKEMLYDNEKIKIIDILTMDGKTINGSEKNTSHGKVNKVNSMSLYSIKNEKTLATEFIDSKTNEIPTGPKLLKRINIKNTVVTFDALNTQKKTIEYIVKNHGYYVAPVKDNHKDFFEEIRTYFEDKEAFKEAKNHIEKDKAHNQLEIREYYFSDNIKWLTDYDKWKDIKSIGMVIKKVDKKEIDRRYFISNIESEHIIFLSNVIRKEWSIENKLHWYLDTTFKEDKNLSYIGNTQKNLNIIRKFCLGILKKVKENYKKDSLNTIRFKLSMSYETEIEKLIEFL